MLDLRSKCPIGIDIDDRNIYAAQLQKARSGIMVRELFQRELTYGQDVKPDSTDALGSALKEVAKNKKFQGKRAVINLPSQYVENFHITFEKSTEHTIEEAIVAECRKYLSFPVEEAVLDYPSIERKSSENAYVFQAHIIAVRREHIQLHIDLAKRVGLSMEAIDSSLSSLLRLHNYLYSLKTNPTILVNIGSRNSLIAVVTKSSILAHRNVAWGTQNLVKRLQTNLELSSAPDQGPVMLQKYGLFYEDHINSLETGLGENDGNKESAMEIFRAVFQILTPYIDELIDQFYQIIGYVRAGTQGANFEEICMYGHASLINHLDHYIEKRLAIPTKCFNPMSKLTISDSSLLPDPAKGAPFALALGLAMRGVI